MAVWYPTLEKELPYSYSRGATGSVALHAPAAQHQQYPLILFSHGWGGCGTQSVFLTEELAEPATSSPLPITVTPHVAWMGRDCRGSSSPNALLGCGALARLYLRRPPRGSGKDARLDVASDDFRG
jgi:hypothetical protein